MMLLPVIPSTVCLLLLLLPPPSLQSASPSVSGDVIPTAGTVKSGLYLPTEDVASFLMKHMFLSVLPRDSFQMEQQQDHQLSNVGNGSTSNDNNNNNNNNRISLRRLARGDFARFNELFAGAKIALPDAQTKQWLVFADLVVKLTNIRCEDISVGDIAITWNKDSSNQKLTFTVSITGLKLNCFADYGTEYGIIRNGGTVAAYTDNNSVTTSIVLTSSNFDLEPPGSAIVENCDAAVDVVNVDFDGDWTSDVANLFERLIQGIIEKEVSSVACAELTSIGPTFLEDAIEMVKTRLDDYLQPISPARADPLHAENNMKDAGVPLLNFRQDQPKEGESNNNFGPWIVRGLQEVDAMLGRRVADPLTGGTDLAVNVMMRQNLLGNDRCLVVQIDKLPLPSNVDGTLFSSHDTLTETVITLDAVKVCGLDTFTHFSSLAALGNHTLQNEFKWKFLTVVLDVTVDIRPSTLPDSLLIDPEPIRLIEKIKIEFGIDNLDVAFSLLLAVNEEQVLGVEIGSLLRSENFLVCFLSVMHKMQVSGLDVRAGNIRDPVLNGFVSPGVDRVVSSMVEVAFLAYESSFIRALPGAFQGPVRDLFNDEVLAKFFASQENAASCPPAVVADTHIDFRNLLLQPDDARKLGGSAVSYGDVAPIVFAAMKDQFYSLDEETSLPKVNDLLKSMTKSQSGTEGYFRFPSDVLSIVRDDIASAFGRSFAERVELAVSDIRIQNVDTVASPLSLLDPTHDAYLLESMVSAGLPNQRISASIRFLVAIEGDNSPLSMFNSVDITASVNTLQLMAGVEAMMSSPSFLGFPLKYMLDIDCWLATFPIGESSLELAAFVTSLSGFALEASCISCTSTGTSSLPEMFRIFKEVGAISLFGKRLERFLAEFMTSKNAVQKAIGQRIQEAHQFCPLSKIFNSSAKRNGVSFGFPALSAESIDSLLFSAVLAAEVGAIIFIQSHNPVIAASFDRSLSTAQTSQDLQGLNLLDWADLGGSFGMESSLLDETFHEARMFINGYSDETGSPRITSLVKDFTSTEGTLKLDLDAVFVQDDFMFSLEKVEIWGLDSFTAFNILQPENKHYLRNHVELLSLGFGLSFKAGSSEVAPQQLSLSFQASNITAEVLALVAIDITKLGALELGSLMFTENIFPCVLSTLAAFDMPVFSVTVGSFTKPKIEGLMPETATAVNASIDAVIDSLGDSIEASIPFIFNTTIKELISSFVTTQFASGSGCPAVSQGYTEEEYVDLRDLFLSQKEALLYGGSGQSQYGNLFHNVLDFINQKILQVDPATGLSSVNFQVRRLTEAQSGEPGLLSFPGDVFNQGTRIAVGGLDARIELQLYDAYIENLDTFGTPLSVLEPVKSEPHMLNNTASIGIGAPLKLGANFLFGLMAEGEPDIYNQLSLSMNLHSLTAIVNLMINILAERFVQYPVRDLSNGYCWLALVPAPALDSHGIRLEGVVPSLSIENLVATVLKLNLNVTCLNCTSPGLVELTELLATPEASDDATQVANKLLDYFSSLLGGRFLQDTIDRLLNDAAKQCPHSPLYDPNAVPAQYSPYQSPEKDETVSFFIAVAIAFGVIFIAVVIFVLTNKFVVRRRNQKWLLTLSRTKLLKLWCIQEKENELESALNSTSQSMFKSPEIPLWIRVIIPLVIVGNIGLFLSGHLNLGATVTIIASFANQTFTVQNFFEFSMARSTVEIWNAGGKELAILILIFSGIWPYVKQCITLFLWFASPKMISVSKRGSILVTLDWLAKWSVVDIFVLVVTVAGFRVSIQSPKVGFLPENFYSLDLLVIPMIVKKATDHFEQQWESEQPTKADATLAIDEEEQSRKGSSASIVSSNKSTWNESQSKPLYCHAFSRPHRGDSDKLVVRRYVNLLLVAIAVALCILIILGCALPSFSLEVLGLIGVAVESGQNFESASTSHSLFSVIGMLFDQAAFTGQPADFVGLSSLSTLMILSVLLVPLLQVATLVFQWFKPLEDRRRHRIAVAVEILQAWQYLEVYLLAVVIASWQLGPVSDFMINEYCGSLSDVFSQLVYYGILDEKDAQCFRVESSLDKASYILAAAAILLALLNTFVMNAVTQYFREKSMERRHEGMMVYQCEDLADDPQEIAKQLKPTPVLFTDKFRWCLGHEDAILERRQPSDDDIYLKDDLQLATTKSTELWGGSNSDVRENNVRILDGGDRYESSVQGPMIIENMSISDEGKEGCIY